MGWTENSSQIVGCVDKVVYNCGLFFVRFWSFVCISWKNGAVAKK